MEHFIDYATASTGRMVVLAAGLLLAVIAWWKLVRSDCPLILKILAFPIPLIPVIGAFIVLWTFSMPARQSKDLRAAMNHYGQGGRFIGNGSGEFTYSDPPDESPDRPVKFKPLFWRRKRRR